MTNYFHVESSFYIPLASIFLGKEVGSNVEMEEDGVVRVAPYHTIERLMAGNLSVQRFTFQMYSMAILRMYEISHAAFSSPTTTSLFSSLTLFTLLHFGNVQASLLFRSTYAASRLPIVCSICSVRFSRRRLSAEPTPQHSSVRPIICRSLTKSRSASFCSIL